METMATNVSENGTDLNIDVDTSAPEDLLPSARDVLSALPANWPDVPQLEERHPWNYSTSVSPSVNKAKEHLELLQLSLRHWIANQLNGTPKQVAAVLSANSAATGSSQKLSIEGIGFHSVDTDCEEGDDLPRISANDVIDETIALVARLEKDRLATLDKLWAEKQRTAMLQAKIDRLALARMIMLPDAVQREHEACSKDLAELKWHITYRSRTEQRLGVHAKKAELLNSQRRDEIERVKRHIPLMQEKVELEQEAMAKIKEAQEKTDEELQSVIGKRVKVNERSVKAFEKAEQERMAMRNELDGLENQLMTVSGQLTEAKLLHEEYVKNCSEYRRKTDQYKRDLPTEKTRHSIAEEKHDDQVKKVDELEIKLRKIQARHADLTLQHKERLEEATKQRESMNIEETELRKEVKEKEEELKEVTLHNKEITMDNEGYERKISSYDKQHETDRKSMERLSRDLDRTNLELASAVEEWSNVRFSHEARRQELATKQQECFTNEHTVKTATVTLRQTIKDEMKRKEMLHTKIDQEKSEISVTSATAKSQKEICLNKEAEVNKVLTEVRGKVDTLQTAYNSNAEILSNLETDLKSVQQRSEEVKQACSLSVDELTPEYNQIKAELMKLEGKMCEMKEGREMMAKGADDMNSSSVMIDRASRSLQQEVDVLQSEADELFIQQSALQNLKDDVLNSIKQMTERDDDLSKQHQALMSERKEIFQEHTASLLAEKQVNQSLASTYRHLQNKLLAEKTELLNTYDDRIKLENDVKDAKQMLAVQQRVHMALQQYYKYRGLYSVAELSRMQSESKFNAEQVSELRQRIDWTIAEMSEFLRSQLESSSVTAGRPVGNSTSVNKTQNTTVDVPLITISRSSPAASEVAS